MGRGAAPLGRDFGLVLAGQAISLLGGAVQRVCIALYLLELTGSAGVYSAVLAASALPYVVCAPVAGAVADAFSRRNVMVALDAVCALAVAAFAATLFAGVRSVALAAVVTVALAVAATFYGPAVSACIPQVVAPAGLARANGAVSMVGSWSNMLGPVLAGALYAAAGIEWACALYASCLAASALLETRIRLPRAAAAGPFGPSGGLAAAAVRMASGDEVPGGEAPAGAGAGGGAARACGVRAGCSVLHTMARTLTELRRNYPVVLGVIMGYGLVNIFVLPTNTVLLPSALMLGMGVSSEVYGLVEGIAASGMAVGAALVALKPESFVFERNYRWFFPLPVALGIMACAVWAGMSAPGDVGVPVAVMAACAMGVMLCLGVTNVVTLTYNQTSVSPAMLGSLSALSTGFASSTVPVGQVVFGALVDAGVGYPRLLAIAAILSAAVCAFVRWNTRRA